MFHVYGEKNLSEMTFGQDNETPPQPPPFVKNNYLCEILLVSRFKPRCWEPPGHYLCTPEPGRLGCVISIQKGFKSEAYPVAVSQKVMENLPVSF